MNTKFKTLDDAIEAVDGVVYLAISEWDDGFTWEISVTSRTKGDDGTYGLIDLDSSEYEDEIYDTPTKACIAACEFAIDALTNPE